MRLLRIKIVAVGKLKEKYLTDGVAEYIKRLSLYCRPEVVELPETRLPEAPSEKEIAAALSAEGKKILDSVSGICVALCIEGKQMSSPALSEYISRVATGGASAITFVIGSSHGLAPEVKARADLRLSMSEMTFPHQLARLMLAEQLYRAMSIGAGGKYHK
ncbi:MAG: 23S rRNA (pseudouridine(1915)-N(3))-methyltransferase RlmH [Oscillospiraceae bacterium]|nr:23S rRNA (pseudouridine(1915)-N(3))-methyltransferase RlmH [Oscillospiraceae bacterium]